MQLCPCWCSDGLLLLVLLLLPLLLLQEYAACGGGLRGRGGACVLVCN